MTPDLSLIEKRVIWYRAEARLADSLGRPLSARLMRRRARQLQAELTVQPYVRRAA